MNLQELHSRYQQVGNRPAMRMLLTIFFQKLESSVSRLQLKHKPQNIFNVDETGFMTDIGNQKILCRRGFRNPHKTVATSTKTIYTVQVCCSAVHFYFYLHTWCTKVLIYTVRGRVEDQTMPNTFAQSQGGWNHHISLNGLGKSSQQKQLNWMSLLVFDGHNSHLSKTVVLLAIANNIELLCLPAHMSSILQPLDVGVFKTVKAKWCADLSHY